jgi:hypothetical protein
VALSNKSERCISCISLTFLYQPTYRFSAKIASLAWNSVSIVVVSPFSPFYSNQLLSACLFQFSFSFDVYLPIQVLLLVRHVFCVGFGSVLCTKNFPTSAKKYMHKNMVFFVRQFTCHKNYVSTQILNVQVIINSFILRKILIIISSRNLMWIFNLMDILMTYYRPYSLTFCDQYIKPIKIGSSLVGLNR